MLGRRVAAGWLLVSVMLAMGGGAGAGSSSGADAGICARTQQVRAAIVAASGTSGCAQILDRHLRDVFSLDLSGQGITSLSADDFDGLHSLENLDLSGNQIASLPEGLFDELFLLRTLRLNGNMLQTVAEDTFEELFLLEELTLHGNRFTSLPEGMFDDLTRFYGMGANGVAPDNSGIYPRIQRFVNDHSITSPEEFIAALPDLYKERFVMVYESEAPAKDHVSGDYPRIISWGADGRMTFAWNTDPTAPSEFKDGVEFLRKNEDDWTAGVVDFSGTTPTITEPASCKSCHGSLSKPMWGAAGRWWGSEFVFPPEFRTTPRDVDFESAVASMTRAMESTDPRIEPLDFDASTIEGHRTSRFLTSPGPVPYVSAVEEAASVWSWRHAEVLFEKLKASYPNFQRFGKQVMCYGTAEYAANKVTYYQFIQPDHNLFSSAADPRHADEPGHATHGYATVNTTYHYNFSASLGDALVFLVVADLWKEEPIVRRLYRSTPNTDTVVAGTPEGTRAAMLHFAAGSATAEDELIQKLRLHFGQGSQASLEALAKQNGRLYLGGNNSANFAGGHTTAMRPRICRALTASAPTALSVALEDGDAVLSWEAPAYDTDSVTGYRVLRGASGADPAVHIADTATATTTWTDENPALGEYVYVVRSLYDDYYPGQPSTQARATVVAFPQAVRNLSAQTGEGQITLSWDEPEGDAPVTGYRILRGPAASSLEVLAANTASKSTTYADTTVSVGAGYFYSVQALNGHAGGPRVAPVRVGPASPVVSGSLVLSVLEGETAVTTLTATDADTDAGDLRWSITAGADRAEFVLSAAGVLAFGAAKDFEAPDDADSDGTYDVTVQVSDGTRTAAADLEVSLTDRNEAPTADAGADQSDVTPAATVTLAGSGTDPDADDTLTYAWAQTAGETVALSAPTAATTTFTAPDSQTTDTTLRFTLTVTDSAGLHSSDQTAVTIAAASELAELTASIESVPARHNGTSPFTFELHLSEEVSISYVTVRDRVFEVTGGDIRAARRRTPGSNQSWAITVRPASGAAVVLVLPAGRACESAGAVCTSDGRPVSNRLELRIEGPASPVVSGSLVLSVLEGETAVTTLTATDADTDAGDLRWSITAGADRAEFVLSAAGVLAFGAAKDFEAPDDADSDGTYDVTVQVSDGTRTAAADLEVSLTDRNEAPTADAGADQSDVTPAATVTLAGSGTDPDADDTLTYAWAQTAGETVALSAPTAATTTFTAPDSQTTDTTLRFTLTVTDSAGLHSSDQTAVTIEGPASPVVSGSLVLSVLEGETAVTTLTATDADTDAGDLRWSITAGADRAEFVLSAAGVLAFGAAKDFEAPDDADSDGTYDVTVQVSDGTRTAAADLEVSLTDRNEAPTADAGADQSDVTPAATVTLAGSGTDPDADDTLTYAWAQTAGETVALSAPTAATTTFTAPDSQTTDTTLRFTLTVTDSAGLHSSDQTAVTVNAASDDATLTSLTLSGVDIAFASDDTEYSADATGDGESTESTTVTAVPADTGASVVITDGAGSTSGTTRTVTLSEGANEIVVSVTAEDGTTTRTYRVTVTLTVTTSPTAGWGERHAARDIVLDSRARPTGLWSDGTNLWMITDWSTATVNVYSLADGSLHSDRRLVLGGGNGFAVALWSDGNIMWVADYFGGVRAYRLSDGARLADRDLDDETLTAAGNTAPTGLWSDGSTMWVADFDAAKVFAYRLSDGTRLPQQEFNLEGRSGESINPFGIWSNGSTILATSWFGSEILAYDLSSGQRQPGYDIDTSTSGVRYPLGIWSDGRYLWVTDDVVKRVQAYAVPGLTG